MDQNLGQLLTLSEPQALCEIQPTSWNCCRDYGSHFVNCLQCLTLKYAHHPVTSPQAIFFPQFPGDWTSSTLIRERFRRTVCPAYGFPTGIDRKP